MPGLYAYGKHQRTHLPGKTGTVVTSQRAYGRMAGADPGRFPGLHLLGAVPGQPADPAATTPRAPPGRQGAPRKGPPCCRAS